MSKVKAVAYLRTSSRTNVGADKDTDKRQRAAIEAYAKAAGYDIASEFYDAAVSGADPVNEREGFASMLAALLANGARTVIVESPDRFARDLMVQLAGHDMLKTQGITLIAASAPAYFTEETPTAVLVRQVLGAVAQFEKATMVAKLKAARDRKKARTGKCEGRKSYAEMRPELVEKVRDLRQNGKTLAQIAFMLASMGELNDKGRTFAPMQIARMLDPEDNRIGKRHRRDFMQSVERAAQLRKTRAVTA